MKKILSLIIAMLIFVFAACAERGTPQIVLEDITQEELRTAEFCVLGDFVIHKTLLEKAKVGDNYDFSEMLKYVEPFIASADFTVANIDGVLGNAKITSKYGYSGYPSFNTPYVLAQQLKDMGLDMLTLANNHALDYWYEGLQATLENVNNIGIDYVGAARSFEEKNTPKIRDICGIKFGILNYTDTLNSMERQAGLDKDALDFGVNFVTMNDFDSDVQKLKSAGAEVIICFMHWGTEYRTTPDQRQINLAQQLNKAGVDIIVGGHPHMVQKTEVITGINNLGQEQTTYCIYSLGNFLSGQRDAGRDGGIIYRFTVSTDGEGNFSVENVNYITCWVWSNGGYQVLPVYLFENQKPEGMSNADYARMLAFDTETDELLNGGFAHKAD